MTGHKVIDSIFFNDKKFLFKLTIKILLFVTGKLLKRRVIP